MLNSKSEIVRLGKVVSSKRMYWF